MMMNLVKTQDGLNSLNDPSRESFWRAHGKMLFAADSRLKSAGQHRENHWRFLGKNTLVGLSMKGRAYFGAEAKLYNICGTNPVSPQTHSVDQTDYPICSTFEIVL